MSLFEDVDLRDQIKDLRDQIKDLRDIDYRNTLAIATLVEILVENGFISYHSFAKKAEKLDNMSLEELRNSRRNLR